jgi:hypothetical protein
MRLVPRLPASVAAPRVHRLQQVEVGAHLDTSAHVTRRQREINDGTVLRQIGIELEQDRADDLLVRPGGAERLAAEHDLTPGDLEPCHVRPCGR